MPTEITPYTVDLVKKAVQKTCARKHIPAPEWQRGTLTDQLHMVKIQKMFVSAKFPLLQNEEAIFFSGLTLRVHRADEKVFLKFDPDHRTLEAVFSISLTTLQVYRTQMQDHHWMREIHNQLALALQADCEALNRFRR